MAKKILIVTGSPRLNGNSDQLAQAFAKGAEEAGNTVTLFSAGRSKMSPCRVCDTCFSKGVACSFDDDFNKLAPLMEEADVIVLASPLYWYDISSQLKIVLDKMYAFSTAKRAEKIHGKESVLLMCGAVTDPEKFRGAVEVYHLITQGSVKWKDRGVILATGCSVKGSVKDSPALQEAYELGKNI